MLSKSKVKILAMMVIVGLMASRGLYWPITWAAVKDDLEQQIELRNQQIKALEAEIKTYQQKASQASQAATSLKGEVDALNLTANKLNADIKLTQTKIANTELKIKQLGSVIGDKTSTIANHQQTLSESLRRINQTEQTSLMEEILAQMDFNDFWADNARHSQLQREVNDDIASLRQVKVTLEGDKRSAEQEKAKLLTLNSQLADQKKIVAQNRQDKDTLLKQTKNQEAGYKQLLADREAKRLAFQKEIDLFEAQLKLALDPSKLPSISSSVLRWPVDNPCITQNFGKTVDAKRLYTSGTHNGIDLRAIDGTPIYAAAAGTVIGTGDTDLVCRGASYGRWVLIKHNNGLSTLYGHFSLIKAVTGQAVVAGQLIGYSGHTGYATGPHLHFSVMASDGVKVTSLQSQVCRGTYVLPVADPRAYIDPLLYLPQ